MLFKVEKTVSDFREGLLAEVETLERLSDWTRSDDAVLRDQAILALGDVGTSAAATLLTEVLAACQWRETKMAILRCLGRFSRSEEAFLGLLKWIHDEDIEMAQEAILALGGLGLGKADQALIELLDRGSSQKKIQCVYALGKLGSLRAVPDLLAELDRNQDANPLLTETLLLALTDIRSRDAIPAFRDFSRALQPTICQAAITGLGKTCRDEGGLDLLSLSQEGGNFLTRNLANWARESADERSRRTAEEVLEAALRSPEGALRTSHTRELRLFPAREVEAALEGRSFPFDIEVQLLESLGTEDAGRRLLARARAEGTGGPEREIALTALAQFASAPHEATLLAMVEASAPQLPSRATLEALVTASGRRALDRLPALFGREGEGPGFRGLGQALVRLAHTFSQDTVVVEKVAEVFGEVVLREDRFATLSAALQGLTEVAVRRGRQRSYVLETLKTLLGRGGQTLLPVIDALGRLAVTEARPVLLELLDATTDDGVLGHVCSALAAAHGGESAPAVGESILERLKEAEGDETKCRMIEALGVLRPHGAVEILGAMLEGASYRLRKAIVIALGNLGDARGLSLLVRVLEHEDKTIVGRAVHAISQLGSDEGAHTLLSYLEEQTDDEVLADKIFRSVAVPAGTWRARFVEILQRLEEVMPTEFLRERANELKVDVMEALLASGLQEVLSGGSKDAAAFGEGASAPLAMGELSTEVRALLDEGDRCLALEGEEAPMGLRLAAIRYCRAVETFLDERFGPRFTRIRQEKAIYDVIENVGFAGTRSNAIDKRFFLEALSGLPHVREIPDFPFRRVETVLEVIYKNQYHRELLVRGLQAWAILILLFGRSYRLERFKIPDLLGTSRGGSESILSVVASLFGLWRERRRITSLRREPELRAVLALRSSAQRCLASLGRGPEEDR